MEVFAWGRGEDGQLGLGDTSDLVEPKLVCQLKGVEIEQIVCGSGHTVVLAEQGKVYTWGRGDDGRLGHGDNGWKYVPRLVSALAKKRIIRVTCGSYHTATISEDGELYTWGGGMYGKLGHGNECGHSLPCRVEGLVGRVVTQVACGSRHTVVLTAENSDVFAWGDKENGVSGHGELTGHQYTPRLVEQLCGQETVQVSACGFHSGVVTASGRVFTWGEGKFGRLGHGVELNVSVPHVIDALSDVEISRIACGGFHTAAITTTGELYTWGGGEHGQLGHGDKVNRNAPTLVKALKGISITQITCGWSHTVGLSNNGTVYTWGNGDHGKLGHGDVFKVTLPKIVETLSDKKIIAVASYNEHTAALALKELPPAQLIEGSSLIQDFGKLVNNEDFSDVTFIVEEKPIYALKGILVARSEHFRAMFTSGMRESASREIEIVNVRYDIFLSLMHYIYTDLVQVDAEDVAELYMIADLYTLDRLKSLCELKVQAQLCHENAPHLLSVADDMKSHDLKALCVRYIVQNFDHVSKVPAFFELRKDLILEVLKNR